MPDCSFLVTEYLNGRLIPSSLQEHARSRSLHQLMTKFCDNGGGSADEFLSFATSECTVVLCIKASEANNGQTITSLWQELRYGCITASKVYDVTHCKMVTTYWNKQASCYSCYG